MAAQLPPHLPALLPSSFSPVWVIAFVTIHAVLVENMRYEIPQNCKHFEDQSYFIDVENSIAGLLWLSQDVGALLGGGGPHL